MKFSSILVWIIIISTGAYSVSLNSSATDTQNLSSIEKLRAGRKYFYKSLTKDLAEEGINFEESYFAMKEDFVQKYKNMNENSSIEAIPLIQHFIYVFGKGRPRTIPDNKVIKMAKLIEKLNQDDSSWKHYIWTNDAKGIPEELLRLNNVQIKYLYELKGSPLYDDIIILSNSPNIFDLSKLSDLARVAILQKYGGVYFDCDGVVFRPSDLKKFMKNFDLVLGEASDYYTIPGAVMASAPDHLFLDIATYLAYRNIHQDEFNGLPEYLKYNYNDNENVIVETGPVMITVAYYKYENYMRKNSVKDNSIVLLPIAFYNSNLVRKEPPMQEGCGLLFDGIDFEDLEELTSYKGIKMNSIASDPGCGEWRWAK